MLTGPGKNYYNSGGLTYAQTRNVLGMAKYVKNADGDFIALPA